MDDIFSIVREMENNYTSGEVQLGKYVSWSMYDTIQTIDAYLNSVHTSGQTDSLGREKPFFNIVSAAANIWYRATDIDRKDISIKPTCSEEVVPAFVGTLLLQDWMTRERFGVFLNLWGRALARYGSAVVKFVKQDGRLIPSVISWARLVVDPIDFNSSPVIEKIFKTPAQLRQMKGYDQEMVEKLIENTQSRETLEGQTKDQRSEFIELYEVHGNLPLSLLTEKEKDENTYRQQMWVVASVGSEEGEKDNYALYKGKEEKSPYMITHLIEEDGRTLSIGAVEYLFDAQWMMNHTMKQQRDYLDLASKLIYQTADKRFVNRNVLSAIESGQILVHQENMPITQVSNMAGNITALQAYSAQWLALSREITSTPDSVRGNTMPSGTPYSLGALLTQNANSLFELMTENKGLAIEDMMREFVIPFLKTKMDTTDEIASALDEQNITQLDAMYIPREAIRRFNEAAVNTILEGGIVSPFNQEQAEAVIKKELGTLGNKRFIKPSDVPSKTWKDVLKDLEWQVIVEVTNEATDKQTLLTTLSTVLQTIASNPMILQDENAKMLFGKILNAAGVVSPIELSAKPTLSPIQPQAAEPVAAGAPTPLSANNIQ